MYPFGLGFYGWICTLSTPESLAFLYLSDLLTVECLSVEPNLTLSIQYLRQTVDKQSIMAIHKNVMYYDLTDNTIYAGRYNLKIPKFQLPMKKSVFNDLLFF